MLSFSIYAFAQPMLILLQAYQFDVSEARRYPHSLGDVVANDLDSGSNGNISYSLSGPGANMFIIDPLNVSTTRQ